jgi:hypothetical protein
LEAATWSQTEQSHHRSGRPKARHHGKPPV